jgi:hypothetical protein
MGHVDKYIRRMFTYYMEEVENQADGPENYAPAGVG